MAAEFGHEPNRVYVGQDGNLYLNGATIYDGDGNSILAALGAMDSLNETELAFNNGVTAGIWAASKTCTLDAGEDATLVDGGNFILGSTTGTKIGTATTQKLGFYNATPVVRQTAFTQTYATASATHAAPTAAVLTVTDGAGTNDGTIGAITADASVIAAIQELAAQINKLVADDANTKQVLNTVIDYGQSYGLFG
jgi:hypothetical protein